MHIDDVLKHYNYKIISGGRWLWTCFGDNSYYFSIGKDSLNDNIDVVFDLDTHMVNYLNILNIETGIEDVWINPEFKDAFITEWNSVKSEDHTDINFVDDILLLLQKP